MIEKMKMTVVDGSSLLALTKWSNESGGGGGQCVRDFLARQPHLPQVARIVHGQYLNVGASGSSFSQAVFLCSRGKRLKVAAQCVKFKDDGRKVVAVGPKLAIPDNYDGWFEILSEEGRAVRCIDSVAELARRFPDSCLVREPLKAYVARGDDLETITDKVRTIGAGETLVLVSEVLGTSAAAAAASSSQTHPDKAPAGHMLPTSTSTSTSTSSVPASNAHRSPSSGGNPGRFLRCFDVRGENVYLAFEQRGKFSILAKEDNISGVHTIKNLMTAKRFPMMVRLVSGKMPVHSSGWSSNFVPELRLFAAFEEECVMAMSMHKEHPIVAIPLTANIKLQPAKNMDVLCKTNEFARLLDTCKALVQDVEDRIHVIGLQQSAATAAALAALTSSSLSPSSCGAPVAIKKRPYFRRVFSDPQGQHARKSLTSTPAIVPVLDRDNEAIQKLLLSADENGGGGDKNSKEVDTRYDEIDQIYDYVRGFAPPPKMVSSSATETEDDLHRSRAHHNVHVHVNVHRAGKGDHGAAGDADPNPKTNSSKPDPPPIETIPARRCFAYPDLLLPATAMSPSNAVGSSANANANNNNNNNKNPHPAIVVPSNYVQALPILIPPVNSLVKRAAENIYERIPRKMLLEVGRKSSGGGGGMGGGTYSPARYFVHSRSSSSGKNRIYVKSDSMNSNGSSSGGNMINDNHTTTTTTNNTNNNNNNNNNNNRNNNDNNQMNNEKNSINLNLNNNSNNSNNINNRQSSGQRSRLFRQNRNSFPMQTMAPPPSSTSPSASASVTKFVKDQASAPLRTAVRSGLKSSTASPIFNIRYKSLTNLHAAVQQQQQQQDFNTLESSNSGGDNSCIYAAAAAEDALLDSEEAGGGGDGGQGERLPVVVVVRKKSSSSSKHTKKIKSSRARGAASATSVMAMVAATRLPRPKSMSNLANKKELTLTTSPTTCNHVGHVLTSGYNCSSDVVDAPATNGRSSKVGHTNNNNDDDDDDDDDDDEAAADADQDGDASVPVPPPVVMVDNGTKRIGTLYL